MFPGSNSDRDAWYAASQVLGEQAELVWHKDTDLGGADAVILPGGFAHGDYLRTGAIARFSPIMAAVSRFAERGGPVLGICNGFQVLLEAGLLPGAMVRNRGIKFVVAARVRPRRADRHAVHAGVRAGAGAAAADRAWRRQLLRRAAVLAALEANRQVDLPLHRRAAGEVSDAANPNGSLNNIAGICNRGAQRRRPDAASRARLRGVARQRRRPRRAAVGGQAFAERVAQSA